MTLLLLTLMAPASSARVAISFTGNGRGQDLWASESKPTRTHTAGPTTSKAICSLIQTLGQNLNAHWGGWIHVCSHSWQFEFPLRLLLFWAAHSQAPEIISHCSPHTGKAKLNCKCRSISRPPVCHHTSPPPTVRAFSRVPQRLLVLCSPGRIPRAVASINQHLLRSDDVVSCCLDLGVPSISFRINGRPVQGMFENFNTDGLFFPVVSFSAGVK